MIPRRVAVSVLALLFFCLAACNRSKTVSTSNGEVKVEESGKPGQSTLTFTDNKGAKVVIASEGSKLPDDYPKDVPVVAGAKVVMSSSAGTAQGTQSSLVLESPDSFDKTVAFYKKAIEDNGWKSDATVSADKMTMISATKDTRHLVVQVTDADGKASVTQSIGSK